MSTPAPGWYPDPDPSKADQSSALRWWDGNSWTDEVRAHGVASGEPAASWGARLGAYLIDTVITVPLTLLLGLPFLLPILKYLGEEMESSMSQIEAGVPDPSMPSQFEMYAEFWPQFLGLIVVSLLASVAYHVGFLVTKGATPGKLMLGLRVHSLDGELLTTGAALKRWAGQYGVGLFGNVPVLGLLASLYILLDGLWPLWDDNRQALHDKWPRTRVVRPR